MRKYLKFVILIAILLVLQPSFVFASSVFGSIDVNNLDFNSISKEKVDDLKSTLQSIDTNSITSSSAFENVDKNAIVSGDINSIDVNKIDINEVAEVYEELSKVISNEDIANFIDDNKEALSKAGANEGLLSTSASMLRVFDADAVIDVMKNDLDLNAILKSYKDGASIESILKSFIKNTSTADKVKIAFKLIFSNKFVRLLVAFFVVIGIYSIFITGYIFKKADKPSFATFIPLYRDIIHLKICNFSPWVLILLFIPIIGWLALIAISVISKFELSKNFGHGFLFGLGLLILPPVFRSYLAFSSDKFSQED